LIPAAGGKWSVGRVVGSPVGAVDVTIGQYTVGDMRTIGSSVGLRDRNIKRPELDIGCGWNFICRDGGGDPWLEFRLVAGLELVGELLVSDRVVGGRDVRCPVDASFGLSDFRAVAN
jgi:hypothetical protein